MTSEGVRKTGNYFLALGILAHTTDEMILTDTALPRFRKALLLVYQHPDTFEDFTNVLENHLFGFEIRYPEFPIEKFVDRIFGDGPTHWPWMEEELRAILQEQVSMIANPAVLDICRDQLPEIFNSLLDAMAQTSSIVNQSLKAIDEDDES